MTAAQGAFLGVIGHVQQFAGVLTGRTDIDQRLAEVGQYLVLERADLLVVAVHDRVVGRRTVWRLGDERAVLGDPLGPAAVHQAQVRVAEQGAYPQRVRRPPVVPVAVEHQGGVPADPLLRHQPGKPGAIDVVAGDRVVELGVPVKLDRPGDVAGLVQQHILVGLGHDQAFVSYVLGNPLGRHQHVRVGVVLELRRGVIGQHHGQPPSIDKRPTAANPPGTYHHRTVTRRPAPAFQRTASRLLPDPRTYAEPRSGVTVSRLV